MKKKVLISLALVLSLSLMGCSKEGKEEVTTCILNSNSTLANYSLKSTYEIHSKKDEVLKVVTKEVVTSSNSTIISTFENTVNSTYSSADKKYGGYDYKISKDGDTLTVDTTIDYSKMDLDKYVEDNTALKAYVNDNNKLTVDGIKQLYTSLGADCE